MWLIPVDTIFALSLALALTLSLTLAISFALCAEVIAEHSAKYKVLFGCELVQRTSDDETDSLQTLASSEIHVQVLLTCRLQQIWNALTLQSLNGLFAVFLVAGKQHHVSHTLMQLVDVIHQYLKFHRSCCRRSHRFIVD